MIKKNICFFGAASSKVSNKYIEETEKLGKWLGQNNFNLVFGGGNTGMMGAIARGFRNSNANITGIVPNFITEFEDVYSNCDDLIQVESMHERKKLMEDYADLFVVGPGGVGTLDELFEVLTDKTLNRYNKSVILFNIDSFYDDIIKFINKNLNNGIINKERFNGFYICNSVDEIKNILHFIS